MKKIEEMPCPRCGTDLNLMPDVLATLTSQRDALVKALEWYAKAGGCAETIEDAARGDIDLSRVSIALTEDCGDLARATLASIKE